MIKERRMVIVLH